MARSYQLTKGRAPELMLLFAEPGSMTRLAKGLGLRKQALSHWHEVPVAYLVRIEELTGISRRKLRPDLYMKREPVDVNIKVEAADRQATRVAARRAARKVGARTVTTG